MSLVLRSQIQESEAIRQTQAIEHIYITADRNRDCALLMRLSLKKAKYFNNLVSAVTINNQLKESSLVISHRSLAICH
ncbi:MAG: hypothetical protein ABI180_04730 [Microcoleus sp.]